jgi:hypothetical protein
MLSDKELSQLPHDNTLAFLQIESAERKKLDGPTKEKIRFYIDRIKETVDKLEIPISKKDTIYKKINALALEVAEKERVWISLWMRC